MTHTSNQFAAIAKSTPQFINRKSAPPKTSAKPLLKEAPKLKPAGSNAQTEAMKRTLEKTRKVQKEYGRLQ